MVVVGLALHEKGPSHVIEMVQARLHEALVEGFGKGDPLGHGDGNTLPSQKIEEIYEHAAFLLFTFS